MALSPSFYQFTPVAIDMSPNVIVRTLNVSTIEHIRPANAIEIAAFPTALTAVVFQSRDNNNIRARTLLSAAVYATVNTAFTT